MFDASSVCLDPEDHDVFDEFSTTLPNVSSVVESVKGSESDVAVQVVRPQCIGMPSLRSELANQVMKILDAEDWLEHQRSVPRCEYVFPHRFTSEVSSVPCSSSVRIQSVGADVKEDAKERQRVVPEGEDEMTSRGVHGERPAEGCGTADLDVAGPILDDAAGRWNLAGEGEIAAQVDVGHTGHGERDPGKRDACDVAPRVDLSCRGADGGSGSGSSSEGDHAHVLELPSGMTTQQHIALLGDILFGPDPGVEDDDGELYEEDPEFELQHLAELVDAARARGWVVLGCARNV